MKSFHRQVTDLRRSRNAWRIFTAVERKFKARLAPSIAKKIAGPSVRKAVKAGKTGRR